MAVAILKNSFGELRAGLNKARSTLALLTSLPAFLRESANLQNAQKEIRNALDSREDRFLELIYTRVYQSADSPYLRLLKRAGCDYSDLQNQVRSRGLEKTLEQLASEGVYLTSDEFKGKKEIIRGKDHFRISPAELETQGVTASFVAQSSGSRNQPIQSRISLDWLRIRALGIGLFLDSHNLCSHAHAIYEPTLPASTAINNLLYNAKFRIATDRWFARRIPVNSRIEASYYYSVTYLLILTARMLGHNFPKPEFIHDRGIEAIVRWVDDKRTHSKACCIKTTASNAAKISNVACKMRISLEGTKFISGGEPFTESKHEVIKRAGATAVPRYNYGGGLTVGLGCANPLYTDEVHVTLYMLAVIQQPKSVTLQDRVIRPLLCTTLHPSAPRLLLNVDNGDYADLLFRDCGCALQSAGLTLHLHHIRSYEKFTGEGMNYFYGDLFELLEKIIPCEFGGGPGDYQLVEEEDGNGQTRLTLLVHPLVEKIDEERLLTRLQLGLAEGSRNNRFMSKLWQDSRTFRIRREVPHASPRGKILPLHLNLPSA
jgi:hypothetical protein